MANIYVRSSDGDNASDGSTWALAKATLAGAAAIDAAGDTIFLSSAHAENAAFAITFTSLGTAAAMTRILSVDDADEPPVALSAGASIANTGSNTITFNNTMYTYGLTVAPSSGPGYYGIIYFGSSADSQFQIHEAMTMRIAGTSSASAINIGRDGLGSGTKVTLINSSVRFGAGVHGIQVANIRFEWKNGVNGGSAVGIESGGTSPTSLFKNIGDHDGNTTQRGSYVLVENVDLSNGSSSMNICGRLTGGSVLLVRNCKLPASWTGSLVVTSLEHGAVATMVNCDNGDTNYKFRQQTRPGVVDQETTVVMTGGATDGDTPISWKLVTNTICGPGSWWQSPEMYVEQTATGSAKTVTVEILHDSATDLTDAEVWLEVCGLGTSGQPLGIAVNDRVADALATAADQPNSSVTWTTTGMANPNKQYLSVSVTPQEKGFLIARVYVAKVSKTLYINPEPIIS